MVLKVRAALVQSAQQRVAKLPPLNTSSGGGSGGSGGSGSGSRGADDSVGSSSGKPPRVSSAGVDAVQQILDMLDESDPASQLPSHNTPTMLPLAPHVF
jgi:hypothetical protein